MFVTSSLHSCHENDRSENDQNYNVFREKYKIHCFRSCYFRDTFVTSASHSCHENDRNENDQNHEAFSWKMKNSLFSLLLFSWHVCDIFVTFVSRKWQEPKRSKSRSFFMKKMQNSSFSLLLFSWHVCDRVVTEFPSRRTKSLGGPENFPVKTQILLANGSKDGCTDDPPDLT